MKTWPEPHLWDRINYAFRLLRVPGTEGNDPDSFLIVDLWLGVLHRDENNARARANKQAMLDNGVPIIDHLRHLAAFESPVVALLMDFEAGRITYEDYRQRRRDLAEDQAARRAWIREKQIGPTDN